MIHEYRDDPAYADTYDTREADERYRLWVSRQPANSFHRTRVRCPDCGKWGERKGHQDCQYPQD